MKRNDNYLCLVDSNKQQIEDVRSITPAENSETKATLKRVWIRPMHSASVVSRDNRIKMKKSLFIISITTFTVYYLK